MLVASSGTLVRRVVVFDIFTDSSSTSRARNANGCVCTWLTREKQIPRCVPRPPNCGGKEKARDSVRDDTRSSLAWSLWLKPFVIHAHNILGSHDR
jgi:hypothetical protein